VKKSNKQGFTLLEMLLAIAIALVISGVFLSLIVAIKTSYYRTYNDDDCADIAAMYAEALENTVLYDIQHGVRDVISIDPNTSILINDNHTITFGDIDNFNRASPSAADRKWDIRMICYLDENTGEFRYQFYFIDLYVQPGYLHYVYEGSFWIPCYNKFRQQVIGQGDEVTSSEVNGWDYNYSAPETSLRVSVAPEGELQADGTISGAEGNMTNLIIGNDGHDHTLHNRIQNDEMGRFTDVDNAAYVVSVPQHSSVITITARPAESS